MSVQESVNAIASRLNTVSAHLTKVLGEVVNKIAELEAKANAGEEVDFTEVNAALEAVAAQAQALDNVVPDVLSEPVEVSTDSEPVVDELVEVPVVEEPTVEEPTEVVAAEEDSEVSE